MSFDPGLKGVYDNGIKPAIEQEKWHPVKMDLVEHTNDIGDEMIAKIRRCRFMVADFTDQNPGVYFEAGFAQGLGRSVIWTCREDQKNDVHFDTEHRNHIFWKDADDLRERLRVRIAATIPK